ncbi:putative receptor-like protein kinase, partial [Quercus suber]
NNFNGGIPGFLGNLSLLIIFSAAYNDLVGNIPESVGRLKSLSYFAVGPNKLNGMVPSSLYNISSIRTLSFSQNQLSGTLPENIGHTLPNLQWFYLSDNKFFGSIPSSLCNASKLQKIDLSNNSFVGSVPTNLGCLQDLYFLHLSVLPSSIGNLSTQITGLYLGGNKISGTIPVALQNLINLIILGMEGNLFTANNTEDFRHIDVDMQKCLLSILNIGILCSLESPKERINMEEVIKELQLIKSTFVGLGIRRSRPSRAQRLGTTRRD